MTQAQWRSVMQSRPWQGKDYVQKGDDYPAVYVNWEDAVSFCEKLSEREGKTYRLPTEAEWEYTCRAGTATGYSFGDAKSLLGDYAWYDVNAEDIGGSFAHAVGRMRPNPFGLYDMHGNVWEWCRDWYGADYYASSPAEDPEGPSSGSSRVLRGGSWNDDAIYARSSYRGSGTVDYRRLLVGFRVVCE